MQNITLDEFEGPLDLLLHLIKASDLDIQNIQIEKITNQYLVYLKTMEALNLDIASEYLTMATELILIKSASLLPNQKVILDEEEAIPDLKSLQNRLLEYQTYKEAGITLQKNEAERKKFISKLPSLIEEYTDGLVNYTSESGDVNSLVNAFNLFLERLDAAQPLETKVTNKEITQEDRRITITNKLKNNSKIRFHELFDFYDKSYIVVTFLTILEMYKKQEIKITQEHNFDDITIERGEKLCI